MFVAVICNKPNIYLELPLVIIEWIILCILHLNLSNFTSTLASTTWKIYVYYFFDHILYMVTHFLITKNDEEKTILLKMKSYSYENKFKEFSTWLKGTYVTIDWTHNQLINDMR